GGGNQPPRRLPTCPTLVFRPCHACLLPLHGVNDGVDGDLYFVADAEHQGAGVLHAPFHVGDLDGCGHVVLAAGRVHRGGEQDFVLHAVNGEHTVQLHL